MAFLTSTSGASLTPTEIGEPIIRPITQESVARQVTTVVNTDAAAAWVPEGNDISLTDPTVA
jgi:predicted phage gp36 major capsid-like protein